MRDEFPSAVKEILAKRVANRCSNPSCRHTTSGPHDNPAKAVNVGVAAHVTAASAGGPRFDPSLTPAERMSPDNGIWLCQTCGKLVDNDPTRFPVDMLREWKRLAEQAALDEVSGRLSAGSGDGGRTDEFQRIERLMPGLLAEMRKDLSDYPLSREFVLLKKGWSYWPHGHELSYYYEDHPELDNKVRILQNIGLITDVTYNNVSRYIMNEEFVRYLGAE